MPVMGEITVAGIGELLWDCFGDDRRPGGAPANVAFHAASLGARGLLCSRVGRDEAGDALLDHLRAHGLGGRFVQRDEEHPTGWVTVDASRPDDPQYTIHEGVAWDHIALDPSFVEALRSPGALCFGTLAQRCPISRATLQRTLDLATGVLRVFDVNLRPPFFTREVLAESFARSDVVKLNEDEVPVVFKLFDRPDEGPEALIRWLRGDWPVRWVCITRGPAGCLLAGDGGLCEEPGRAIEGADAVGAGDAFTAALVCGILLDWPIERIAGFANAVGGIVAGRSGAMPNVRDKYASLLENA